MRLFGLLFVLSLACASSAAPVSAGQAKAAVGNWLGLRPALGCRLGASAEAVRTCAPADDVRFHVVRLAGGGFVVTSADTRLEPVIAFSDSDDLDESDANPLWALLKGDLAARTKSLGGAALQSVSPGGAARPSPEEARWAKLLAGGAALQSAMSVSDIRVAPLVKSRWGQGGNSYYSDVGEPCYNFFTPDNCVCGCVATALAQLMRFHRHPASVQAVSRVCAVDGVQRQYTMLDGDYDYDAMKLVPEAHPGFAWYDGGATLAQRQAIGKLAYNCSVAMQTSWTSRSSAAGGAAANGPLKTVFGYASAHTATAGLSDPAYRDRILRTNLDAGCPVMLGVDGPAGGHEILADGYGFSSSVLYTHLNMGWSGSDDAWYALPAIEASSLAFDSVTHAVYNIFPDRTGEIVSGRVTTSVGAPVSGAAVSISLGGSVLETRITDDRGIYAFVVPGGATAAVKYVVRASLRGSESAPVTASVRTTRDSFVRLDVGGYAYNTLESAPVCGNVLCDDLVLSGLPAVANPVFSPAGCRFFPETNVAVTCATADATVRYTLDGTDPTESSPVYTGAIHLDTTTMLKARAFKDGAIASAVVAAVYTYDLALGGTAGDFFANPIPVAQANGSLRVPDNSAYTLESGEPLHTLANFTYYPQAKSIWFRWTAPGAGTVTFTTECALVATNGSTVSTTRFPTLVAVYSGDVLASARRLAFGATGGGAPVSVSFAAEQGRTYRIVGAVMGEDYSGAFTLSWSGSLAVTPVVTSTTDVPVPYAWLDGNFPGTRTAAEYEALALGDADGDGFATWQEYLCGTDPADAGDVPRCAIEMRDGAPYVTHNVVVPLAAATEGWRMRLLGSNDLAAWTQVGNPLSSGKRFFKVVVEKR